MTEGIHKNFTNKSTVIVLQFSETVSGENNKIRFRLWPQQTLEHLSLKSCPLSVYIISQPLSFMVNGFFSWQILASVQSDSTLCSVISWHCAMDCSTQAHSVKLKVFRHPCAAIHCSSSGIFGPSVAVTGNLNATAYSDNFEKRVSPPLRQQLR